MKYFKNLETGKVYPYNEKENGVHFNSLMNKHLKNKDVWKEVTKQEYKKDLRTEQ